jgi:hypothetical protein
VHLRLLRVPEGLGNFWCQSAQELGGLLVNLLSGLELTLELLELTPEALVWMNEVSDSLNMIHGILVIHVLFLHQVGNDNGRASRHSSEAMD